MTYSPSKKIYLIWMPLTPRDCIIRAQFLGDIKDAFDADPDLQNLLLADYFKNAVENSQEAWREVIATAVRHGVPVPAFSSALAYYDGYRSAVLPASLLQAQRDAAWGEVARRLAHEIKNPLTPIQLSAERMRHKYLHTMPEEEAQILDRATHTIVQQVEAMKEMVNAFSDYARAPDMDTSRFDLDKLAHEVVDLYRAQESDVRIVVTSDPTMPLLEADEGRVRQILHNLLRNAMEALEIVQGPQGGIHLEVACRVVVASAGGARVEVGLPASASISVQGTT